MTESSVLSCEIEFLFLSSMIVLLAKACLLCNPFWTSHSCISDSCLADAEATYSIGMAAHC